MPELIVSAELPLRFTEPRAVPPVGTGRPDSGSATAARWVIGFGFKWALPEVLTPPTTWMLEAVTTPLPLTRTAVAEVESTTLMLQAGQVAQLVRHDRAG